VNGPDWLLSFAIGVGAVAVAYALSIRYRLCRPNFAGERIPTGVGLFLPLTAVLAATLGLFPHYATAVAFTTTVTVFSALGFLDDLYGNREVTGLRGHVVAFITQGRITTGLLKLVGGTGWALILCLVMHRRMGWGVLLDAACIALSANAFNLFDLRPSRALQVFWVASLAVVLSAPAALPYLQPLWVATLLYAPLDFRARAMLGDTGSNALGATVGLAAVLWWPVYVRTALLLLLLGLHIITERVSLSEAIRRVLWVDWIDRWGTPRTVSK